MTGAITDVAGVRVGHWSDRDAVTGCTVILCPPGTIGAAEVRGGAASTRGTDSLRPGTRVGELHAVVLSGGSAFGLAAASGVERWLEERGVGLEVGPVRVPIVAAAILFDLGVGDPARRPGPDEGYAACEAASDGSVAEGSVGAGTGATVAKLPDPELGVKGGLGTASRRERDLVVGSLAAVNAVGDVIDRDGRPIATNRAAPGTPVRLDAGANTTLVAVATNARLSRERAFRLTVAGHDGLATAIRPAHTLWDGDTVFALATGEVETEDQLTLERLAAEATAEAIRRGVMLAEPLGGVPSAGEAG